MDRQWTVAIMGISVINSSLELFSYLGYTKHDPIDNIISDNEFFFVLSVHDGCYFNILVCDFSVSIFKFSPYSIKHPLCYIYLIMFTK